MRNALATLLILFLAAGATTHARAQQINLDALAKQPGFQVTTKVVKGEEVTEIRKATVVITISPRGTVGWDSGHTAILCAWQIYVDLKLTSDIRCPDSEPELKRDLTDAVEGLKDFIVANSLTPVARTDLDAFVQKRWTEKFSRVPKSVAGTEKCPMLDWLADFQKDGQEKRRAELATMLACPRPPGMN